MDQCLGSAFRPGMGRLIPDRMFWAQPDDDEQEGPAGRSGAPGSGPGGPGKPFCLIFRLLIFCPLRGLFLHDYDPYH